MKAMVCPSFGSPEVLKLGTLPEPSPTVGQVAIRVTHAGVSYVDALMVSDRHQNKHELPFAPGLEVAGEVVALGPGVEGFSVGQRVAALVYDGGWAELAVADATEVFPIPEGLANEVAAASLSVYLTAYLALTDVAQLKSGEVLLVTGASGGVGLATVEIGHALNASVVACASTQEKLRLAKHYGADIGLLYGGDESLRAAIHNKCDEGTDVVIDLVAGDLFESIFRSLRWGGRYISVGFAGGEIPKIPANLLLVKHRSARGFILMYYRRYRQDLLRSAATELFDWMSSGRISPLVSRIAPLADAPELLNDILSRQVTGKGVLVVG